MTGSGMRLREVLGLRWSQVNLKLGVIKLSAEDTKTEEPRTVFLTSRVRDALEAQPRHIKSDWVFTNPETEAAWKAGRLVPRPATQLRHQRAPARSAGTGDDENVGPPHEGRLRPLQHRRGGRPARCGEADRSRHRQKQALLDKIWTK
jgi:integrase